MRPLLVASAAIAMVLTGVLLGLNALAPVHEKSAQTQRLDQLGQLVKTMISASGRVDPVASDGRIDVYAAIGGNLDPEGAAEFLRLLLDGDGPSADEIRRGDYARFPFERAQAPLPDRESGRPRPILWSRADAGPVLVAFSNGSVKALEPSAFAAIPR